MRIGVISIAVCLLLCSCRDRDKSGKQLDTPTTGSITIAADESLRPLVEAEVDVFNSIYTRAHVDVVYAPEIDVIEMMMKDSMKVAVLSRRLSADEINYFKEVKKISRIDQNDVATSGIAVIVNPANPDTVISIAQLKSLLRGEISNWKDIGGRSRNGIEIVFDNAKSALVRYLKDSIAKVEKLPANCYAVQNNEAVVNHVAQNVNALGLIGVEWVSDDPATNKFLKKIKVMGVSSDSIPFQPYQAYMALKHYPLMRTITVVNRESRTGLGTGFSSFFASERGQRIVLKSGLLPKTMPLRIIQVNPKGFKVEK
jgi:phosphate transport system substrate-binding protein